MTRQVSKKSRHVKAKEVSSRESSKDKDQTTELSSKYKDVDMRSKENEITKLKYFKDIGLVATAFQGTVKIFDSINFHQIWQNSNKNRTELQHTNIVTFDLSPKMGMMATGGAEGKLVIIDPYAFGLLNSVVAHKHMEIVNLFCFEEQQ